ncbi:exonuclease [Paecilomyces variotii No. 5]|uniref:Exonuclease n=1 Tax=Byssochlamys spectabilis (strain No. 5 / NBRC 109023) TaxID=1356009 RepID=V5I5L6_BYSSN|nr:exonuclease [Paecilomyces variotii No. 5]
MGIQGLHGLLKSIQKPCNLKKFSGQTLCVDAYGWLHRGTVACAVDLALDRHTSKHLDFVINRVRMLLYFGVTPYLVFDGDNLPSKSGTEAERHSRRQESKQLGMDLYRKGRMSEAHQELQKAIDVTPYMARQLIEELKKMEVQYVVAPYEADAQMVYLEQQGIVNGIISEDSDLLVFGAKRLLSKLDQHGDCIEISRCDFSACKDVSFIGWTDADFRRMCILSGCDYLASIPKMGLKTAYRSIRKYKNVERVLRMLQFEGKYHIPTGYLENFKQAELTFLYQRVFCPKAGRLVTLTPPDDSVKLDEMPFIGHDLEPDVALGVACGDLDPMTKERIVLKPVIAGRLTPSLTRRQTLASATELKPNKPINSFFTPKRMPLAELDPNSLTPSPSQQRLLERNANSSWSASPAPERQGLTRSASAVALSRPSGSPMIRTAERESFLARAGRVSAFQSTKRQRLCSDADEEKLPSSGLCRSKFFTTKAEDPSPSGQKATRVKKARKSDFGVFSDDVAENIMSSLPDPAAVDKRARDGSSMTELPDSGRRSSAGLNTESTEVPAVAHEGRDSPQNSPSAASSNESSNVQSDVTSPTTATSVSADGDPELFNQVLKSHVRKLNSNLLSKYAFQDDTDSASTGNAEVCVNKPAQEKVCLSTANSNAPTLKPRAVADAKPLKVQRLTPLQRLGQSAFGRSKSLNQLGSQIPDPLRDSGYESDFGSTAKNVAAAIPAANDHGSEDFLVPNSEEDDIDDSEHQAKHSASVNLSRFSYTPK